MSEVDIILAESAERANLGSAPGCDISVVVATFNRREPVGRLLASLSRQTLSTDRFEIIVVSDGSTDGTVDFVRESMDHFANVKVLDLRNRGPAAARNSGAGVARGRYLAFTDDDCVATENWLEELLRAFERTGAVAVQGQTTTDHSVSTPLTHQIEVVRPWVSAMQTCNAAYSKKVFEAIGGFDESFRFAHNEDRDLVWRAEEFGRCVFAPEAHIMHPPRDDYFWKTARRAKVFESDFLLYYKDREKYRKYISRSPWLTIYWRIFIVQQWSELTSNFRYLIKRFEPLQFFIGLGLICMRWCYLVRFFPEYFRAQKFYRAKLLRSDPRLPDVLKEAGSRSAT